MQNLTLTSEEGRHELNIRCDMAKGAGDKNCTIKMRSETGTQLRNCFSTSGRNITCKLGALTSGKYLIQAYDWESKETPAVECEFPFTEEVDKDLTMS